MAGWPVLRRGMIATHPLSPVASVPTMLVDIRSFGGDSGGPLFVLVDGKPHVAGVHRDLPGTPFDLLAAMESPRLPLAMGLNALGIHQQIAWR